MVELLCPHCDENLELPDGDYGVYSCPHCDDEFDYEKEEDVLVGIPTKFDGGHEKEMKDVLFDWGQFFIGLGISSFCFIPVSLSLGPGGGYGPNLSGVGVLFCWLWPLSGLGTTIVGFTMGNKALGIGGLVGIAIWPFLFFFGCLLVS